MITNQSITFFDTQFQKQVANNDFALNPFEKKPRRPSCMGTRSIWDAAWVI